MSDSLRSHALYPISLLCPWGLSRREYWSRFPCPSSKDLPNPGTEPRSPTLQADSLLFEPPGKPKNTGVGSLSLLQEIFLTQESNQGLLHWGWILYQLSFQGSTSIRIVTFSQGLKRHSWSDSGLTLQTHFYAFYCILATWPFLAFAHAFSLCGRNFPWLFTYVIHNWPAGST